MHLAGHLAGVVAFLSDANANHWDAGPVLRSIVEALDGLNDAAVADARNAAQLAYDELIGTEDR